MFGRAAAVLAAVVGGLSLAAFDPVAATDDPPNGAYESRLDLGDALPVDVDATGPAGLVGWYSWTSPVDGVLYVFARGTEMTFYEGAAEPELERIGTDFFQEDPNDWYWFVPVEMGETYTLRAAALACGDSCFPRRPGFTIDFSVRFRGERAPNDDITDAGELVGELPLSANRPDGVGTIAYDEPNPWFDNEPFDSLWWTWTAPAATGVLLDYVGPDELEPTVYTGSVDDLELVGQSARFAVDEGQTIFIQTAYTDSFQLTAVPDEMCAGLFATIVGTVGNDLLHGTAGDDVIVALGGDDVVHGGGGHDTICVGPGTDTALGGTGDDTLVPGTGADDLGGGPGSDTVDYSDAPAGVTVWADGLANDGIDGERDNIRIGIENIIGSPFGDVLVGGPVASKIIGGGGDDMVYGQGGNDDIDAGPGNDRVNGGAGNDLIDGGPGDDHLRGGEGDDRINGGHGDDILRGGAGRDTLDGGLDLGEDRLIGGPGDDTLNGRGGTDYCRGSAGLDRYFLCETIQP